MEFKQNKSPCGVEGSKALALDSFRRCVRMLYGGSVTIASYVPIHGLFFISDKTQFPFAD